MKRQGLVLSFLALVSAAAAQVAAIPEREADRWVGFALGEDSIVSHEFVNKGSQILLFGNRLLQLHDVETGKRIYSVEHNIPQFMPGGFLSRYILLGLPELSGGARFLSNRAGNG